MTDPTSAETSVAPAHQMHPTLSTNQVLAAHILAELPLGMTWQEKADKMGVSRETLGRYRQVPEFIEEVIKVSRANLRAEIPGAHQAMVKGMLKGGREGARYLEMFLKVTGELQDQEQASALKGWLDAVGACASDLLIVALQRGAGRAPVAVEPGAGRVVASREIVAQRGREELTAPPCPGVALERELDL